MHGRPVISGRTQFAGEDDVYFDGTASNPTWIRKSITTTYAQPYPDDAANERSPAFASHLMVAIDFQNIPAMSFYIDDLKANFLG